MPAISGLVAVLSMFAATIVVVTPPTALLKTSPASVPVLFVGDMMFDRTVRMAMEKHGDEHPLSCITPLFKGMPLVVGNLEGTITALPSKSKNSKVGEPANTTFTFSTSTAAMLKRNNIGVVNLGNNHILDFGRDGLSETKAWLFAAGVEYFGDPVVSASEAVLRKRVGEVELSFINWNEWYGPKVKEVLTQIDVEKSKGRVVVVYTHWGDEYVRPPARVKNWARQFVEHGADIVIGTHPHVVQEHEVYKDKHIYYSLGNFVFDQFWNSAVSTGLTLKVNFTPKGVASVEEIPVQINRDRSVCVIE